MLTKETNIMIAAFVAMFMLGIAAGIVSKNPFVGILVGMGVAAALCSIGMTVELWGEKLLKK